MHSSKATVWLQAQTPPPRILPGFSRLVTPFSSRFRSVGGYPRLSANCASFPAYPMLRHEASAFTPPPWILRPSPETRPHGSPASDPSPARVSISRHAADTAGTGESASRLENRCVELRFGPDSGMTGATATRRNGELRMPPAAKSQIFRPYRRFLRSSTGLVGPGVDPRSLLRPVP